MTLSGTFSNLAVGLKPIAVVTMLLVAYAPIHAYERLRVIVETDAGGDPDDEQSMVRFLLYSNEWDVEGIICNRAERHG